jgi:DNA replication initiation complex subunit (GINS family)
MTQGLLPHEKTFFEDVISVLSTHKSMIATTIFTKPNQQQRPQETYSQEKQQQTKPDFSAASPAQTLTTANPATAHHASKKTVKFLSSIPRFIGKELEVYGPYQQDETVELPLLVAEILIKKGRAVAL